MQVGIDGYRRGLQILHGERNQEIAEGSGTDDDEGHLQHAVPAPCRGVERIGREFRNGDGNRDNRRNQEHIFHLCHRRILRSHITGDNQVDGSLFNAVQILCIPIGKTQAEKSTVVFIVLFVLMVTLHLSEAKSLFFD